MSSSSINKREKAPDLKCKEQPEVTLKCAESEQPATPPSTDVKTASTPTQEVPAVKTNSLASILAAESGPLSRERSIEIAIRACGQLICQPTHGRLTPSALQLSAQDEVGILNRERCAPDYSHHAAPEVRDNPDQADARSDVYSLGAILYEMLSNKNNSAAQHEVGKENLSNMLAYSPSWGQQPIALKQIIRKCLQSEPILRYQTVEELHEELERFLRPPRTMPTKTNWTPLIVAAAATLLLAVGAYAYQKLLPTLPLNPFEAAAIGKYEVVMLVDRSGSMGFSLNADPYNVKNLYAPRNGADSRWNWVNKTMQDFATQTKGCLPAGFSVITFSSYIQQYDNCDEAKLAEICKSETPNGGTELAPALEAALAKRETITKPLAVIVVTDGAPQDGGQVTQDIISATNTGKDKVKIVFLTVGTTGHDQDLITSATKNLTSQGAKYDAVTSLSFDELNQMGLSHAIARAIETEKDPNQK